jgi:hypothetical protein
VGRRAQGSAVIRLTAKAAGDAEDADRFTHQDLLAGPVRV